MHNKLRKFAVVLCVAGLLFTACGDTNPNPGSTDTKTAQVVESQQNIYTKGQPVPTFDFSEPRNDLIQIYTATVQAHDTWTVFYSHYGQPLYVCPSKGFPIPVTTQLTSPSYAEHHEGSYNGGNIVLPQPEPNGLYTGQTSGTWVLCVRPDGNVEPVYSEPDVMAFTHAVKIQNGAVVDVDGAKSTVNISIGKK